MSGREGSADWRPRRRLGLRRVLFAVAGGAALLAALAGARVAIEGSVAGVVVTALAAALLAGAAAALVASRVEAGLERVRDALAGRAAPGEASRFAGVQDVLRAARTRLREEAARAEGLERERADLEALLSAAGEGILLVSPEALIARANPAAIRFLGLPDEPGGASIDSTIRATGVRRAIHAALRRAEPAATEHEMDGRRVFVMVQPVEGQGAVVSLVDLTEMRRLETARRDFVANASHELKTPLTSIRGYAETLQDESLPPDVRRRFLDTIRQNAERLQRVVDDLLDLSRIEAGAWEPDTRLVRIADSAREAWASLEARARGRDVTLTLEGDASLEVLADPFALRQILTNLLDNALRYSDDPAAITIGATDGSGEDAGGMVRIDVTDRGAGIPSDAIPRIFERFFRVDQARTGAAGGTGLGLAIVKHLVEQMGGRVHARSRLGHGTTVAFTLPAAPGASPVRAVGRGPAGVEEVPATDPGASSSAARAARGEAMLS